MVAFRGPFEVREMNHGHGYGWSESSNAKEGWIWKMKWK
jgi:hypothetical protein